MRLDTRMGLALAVALPLQLLPWTQLTRHTAALQLTALTIVIVLATGWIARRLRLPGFAVVLVQAAALAAATVGGLWWVHGPAQVSRLFDLPVQGIEFIRGSTAPMFPNPGATLLIVAGVGLMALVADWLGITAERPGWAIAPLVALHLVVALALATPTEFGEFLLLAVGIVLVLIAASPWGSARLPVTRAAAWATAVALTAGAAGLTWVAGQAVPPFEPRRTSEPLQMSDPTLDLKRNLVQGSDAVIIRYTTDTPGGTYLKLASLPALSTGGFALSDVRVATGRIPAPPGSPSGTPRTTSVEVGDFRSEWLPVPYAPTSFEAPGEWGFALDTLDVMALAGPARTRATEGISYEVRSLEVNPDDAAIAGATANGGPARDLHVSLPTEVPARVRELAVEVTEAAPTAGAKAQALEAYLHSDLFTYSTAASTGTGDGIATIDDFLFGSRTGYCEQYAGAMAIMARALGIPTRMAVGFVPGTQEGEEWGVSARDLHTWPELWLDGYGWVAFEPTPSRGDDGQGPGATAAPPETAQPTAGATAEASPTPTPEPAEATPTPEAAPSPQAPVAPEILRVVGWLTLGLLAAVVGFFVVRALRARSREQRLAGTGDPRADTLAAWEVVRETASGLRVAWPDGSPRFAAEKLVGSLGGNEEAAEALRSLASASERALYDRRENYDLQGSWADEVGLITTALTEQARADARERRNARPRRAAR